MDEPGKVPLEDAVARGVIPCGRCGAPGAAVREVGGRKHFLCPSCANRSRHTVMAAGLALLSIVVAVVAIVAASRGGASGDEELLEQGDFAVQLGTYLREQRYAEARELVGRALEREPDDPFLHYMMGDVLSRLQFHEKAVVHLREALKGGAKVPPATRLMLARSLYESDRAAEAVPLLKAPYSDEQLDAMRVRLLVECQVFSGAYEEALALLGPMGDATGIRRLRHRCYRYLGRESEAAEQLRAIEAAGAERLAAHLRAIVHREDGDFDGARRELKDALERADGDPSEVHRLRRSELAVLLEAGDWEGLEKAATGLAAGRNEVYRFSALWFVALGRLLAGDRESAVEAARRAVEAAPEECSPVRKERLMMLHLAGGADLADVEREAKASAGVSANDLYLYLAAATGERAWAERGLEVTPGRNFPYHALKRLAER